MSYESLTVGDARDYRHDGLNLEDDAIIHSDHLNIVHEALKYLVPSLHQEPAQHVC